MSSGRRALCGAVLSLSCLAGRADAAPRRSEPPAKKEAPSPKSHSKVEVRTRDHAEPTKEKAHQAPAPRDHAEPTEEKEHQLPHAKKSAEAPAHHAAGHEKAKRVPPRPERKLRPLPPNATWAKYRRMPWRLGYVTLAGHGKKWSGYLVDKYGDVNPSIRESLSSALASWRTGKQIAIDDRLVKLIADVSDEFGGRPIRIVSGYREHSYAPDSRHKTGEAFDFSIPDVPNEALRDYLRSLHDVGVGYYPNSTHVHLDVRDKATYWVDYSRPGDRPVYAWDRRENGMTPAEKLLASALESLAAKARSFTGAEASTAPKTTAQAGSSASNHTHAKVSDDSDDEREDDTGEAARPHSGDAGLPSTPAAAAFSDAGASRR